MNKPKSYDKQMEEGWLRFRRETIHKHAVPAQLRESARCFYSGAVRAMEVLFDEEIKKGEHEAIINGFKNELIRASTTEGIDIPDSGHGLLQ